MRLSIQHPETVIEGRKLASDFDDGLSSYASSASASSVATQRGSAGRDAEGGALGTYTKSYSPLEVQNLLKAASVQARRDFNYRVKNSIRRVVMRSSGFNASEIVDFESYNQLPRVVKCTRTRVNPDVKVHKSKEHGKAFYSGLTVCGSSWVCPTCVAKIEQRRRIEIEQGMIWGIENNLLPVMFTFTFPHKAFHCISDLLEKQSKALKYLRTGKAFQKFKERVGFEGLIRSLEITHGRNGWHPHTHEIWFVSSEADREALKKFVAERWEKACSKVGLIPKGKLKDFRAHAVDARFNVDSAEYLAKQDNWNLACEMSLSTKKNDGKTVHPFELAIKGDAGCEESAQLFMDYLEGVKGKPRIFWSRGLKKRAGLTDVSDQEIAEQEDDHADELLKLECHAWQTILDEGAVSLILTLAENEGVDGIRRWLAKHALHEAPTRSFYRR